MNFPFYNSKNLSNGQEYNLYDPLERRKYFEAKLGKRVEKLKEYLEDKSFVGYMIGKKQAGKGTYAKMVEEILGSDRFTHISVGDVIRETHENLLDPVKKTELISKVEKHYRGYISFEKALEGVLTRSQSEVSVSDELVLALLKTKIDEIGKKALFIDGLPRNHDQISYSLYFRDLINYRDDRDFFILLDVPIEVIKLRMQGRVICPICKTSKNILINPTKFIDFDKSTNQFLFKCDNSLCSGFGNAIFVTKEGDSQGIDSIKKRIELDNELLGKAFELHGIPKVLIAGTVPVKDASNLLENYEIQRSFTYEYIDNNVKIIDSPCIVKDDNGEDSFMPFAATYVVSLISQICDILDI